MFNAASYRRMLRRFVGPTGKKVTLQLNNGAAYDEYTVTAFVTGYAERDLIAGGSIRTGDKKVMIPNEYLPAAVTRMTQQDRIIIDGGTYAVINWDDETGSIGPDKIFTTAAVRG